MNEKRRIEAYAPPPVRGFDGKEWSDAKSRDTGRTTKTQQAFGDEVDINTIMRRFGITGLAPFGNGSGIYGDFSGITDFESAVERVEGARAAFMKLPPEIRERANNDPGVMVRMANELSPEEFSEHFSFVEPKVPDVIP